jgi:hypothetical protein
LSYVAGPNPAHFLASERSRSRCTRHYGDTDLCCSINEELLRIRRNVRLPICSDRPFQDLGLLSNARAMALKDAWLQPDHETKKR